MNFQELSLALHLFPKAMNQSPAIFFKKNGYVILISFWLAFEILWVCWFGFNFKMESLKYIRAAEYLIQNKDLSEARYFFYLTTILIIALSLLLKTGLYGAIVLTLVINLFCYLYFYRALVHLFSDSILPLVICLFLISFWPYQLWSVFLYTESTFYSLVLLLFSRLILFKKMSVKFILSTAIILVAVVISRPLGILFVIPVLLFIYFNLTGKQKIYFYLALLLSFVLINKIVQIVFTTTSDWNIQRPFLEESIICDLPVPLVDKNIIVSHNPNALYQLGFYISHNFPIFLRLALTRLRYFFFMVRDYYSPGHNTYLLIYIGFLYTSILVKFQKISRTLPKPLLMFIFFSILFFALAVAFQCDDYHNRFFLTLMPMFVVLAATAILGGKSLSLFKYENIKVPGQIL